MPANTSCCDALAEFNQNKNRSLDILPSKQANTSAIIKRGTLTKSNINHIITLSKTMATKQQLLKTAAETHFYRKRLGPSTL